MAESAKWKSKLLSSSLPLEYQTARTLVTDDWSVTADYPYLRVSGNVETEFTVDIHAMTLVGDGMTGGAPPCAVDLLVECKHRHPGTAFLFLPDPNFWLRLGVLGSVLRPVDTFSCWFFRRPARRLDQSFTSCYKGVEIDLSTGNVYDAEIRHGITQLQFAWPALLTERIREIANEDPVLNTPFFSCSILLTNTPLYVAHGTFGPSVVEAASSLDEIATRVPYLSLFVEAGPQFSRHLSSSAADLPQLLNTPSLAEAEAHRSTQGATGLALPSGFIAAVKAGAAPAVLARYFERIVVCEATHFRKLLKVITSSAKKMTDRATTELPAETA